MRNDLGRHKSGRNPAKGSGIGTQHVDYKITIKKVKNVDRKCRQDLRQQSRGSALAAAKQENESVAYTTCIVHNLHRNVSTLQAVRIACHGRPQHRVHNPSTAD